MGTTKATWFSSLRQFKVASLLSVIALTFTSATPAIASRGGVAVPSTSFSVGYTFKLGGVEQVCSGSLISPTIIVTAAHCVVDEAGNKSSDYIFAAPGTSLDAPINPAIKAPAVLKVFTVPGFVLTTANEKDDIAFIQLDKALATKGFLRVATASEVAALADKSELTGYGFGDVYETNAPYSAFTRKYSVLWNSAKGSTNTVQISSTKATACSGDSGGPLTTKLASGEEVLVAAMSGAAAVVNRCGTPTDGIFTMRVTTVNPYLYLIAAELKASLASPTPSASPTPKPSVSIKTTIKKYKITCVKGKVKKYVTGTNPKCPSGYKQSAKVLISK